MFKKYLKYTFIFFVVVLLLGFVIPEPKIIPVEGARVTDWNPKTFWYEPWGRSGVHKGIDIFAPIGNRLNSTTNGIVLFTGNISMGGNIVLILGPKWRLHYYAHLDTISTKRYKFVSFGNKIGTVGDTGNAKGKPSHLHYSIVTLIPYIFSADNSTQGWKKMFFLDPGKILTN